MIAAWLPDVEKFSKEIGKQKTYIDSLKERIGQESDYAGRMRDEKYEFLSLCLQNTHFPSALEIMTANFKACSSTVWQLKGFP